MGDKVGKLQWEDRDEKSKMRNGEKDEWWQKCLKWWKASLWRKMRSHLSGDEIVCNENRWEVTSVVINLFSMRSQTSVVTRHFLPSWSTQISGQPVGNDCFTQILTIWICMIISPFCETRFMKIRTGVSPCHFCTQSKPKIGGEEKYQILVFPQWISRERSRLYSF